MMGRIEDRFRMLKQEGRKGLVAYLTAGDPDPSASEQILRTAVEAGIDVLELGMPFSDPTADGPTIQAASRRALESGMTLEKAFELVRRLRADYTIPIVLFGYANPLFHYGYERACADAAQSGVDGLLVVDLPFEEAAELRGYMREKGLAFISLVAPTTLRQRAEALLREAEGFVYYIMVTGVTGARSNVASDIAAHVDMLRECTNLPIAVGFGVSSGEQAKQVARSADAVVVGSALVEAAQSGTLRELVTELRQALDSVGAES